MKLPTERDTALSCVAGRLTAVLARYAMPIGAANELGEIVQQIATEVGGIDLEAAREQQVLEHVVCSEGD